MKSRPLNVISNSFFIDLNITRKAEKIKLALPSNIVFIISILKEGGQKRITRHDQSQVSVCSGSSDIEHNHGRRQPRAYLEAHQ